MNLNAQSPATDVAKPSAHGMATGGTILETVLASLEDAKAEDINHIDIAGKSSLADHMVVTSGRSQRHVNAVSDRLLRDLKTAGHGNPKVEGMPACDWVLVDTGDVIVHIFRPEVREFYNLEKMWSQVARGEAEPAGQPLHA